MRPLDGKARVTGVIGHPVGHSLSPWIHNHWLEAEKINGLYIPLPIQPESFERLFPSLPDLGIIGVNLTIPYKQAVQKHLIRCDEAAQAIGAVNTVCFTPEGPVGYNTDAEGFARSLDREIPNWAEKIRHARILGAGGAARAILHALKSRGITQIELCNRSHDKAEALAKETQTSTCSWSERDQLSNTDLLINTTSLGMTGEPALDMDLTSLPSQAIVADIVYRPGKTALLQQAAARSCRTVGGLGMLVFQAQAAFEYFYGKTPAITDAFWHGLTLAVGSDK